MATITNKRSRNYTIVIEATFRRQSFRVNEARGAICVTTRIMRKRLRGTRAHQIYERTIEPTKEK